MKILRTSIQILALLALVACGDQKTNEKNSMSERKSLTAKDILGNPEYLAISYGGYRQNSRDIQPTVEQLKEDMKILSAMGVGLLRTYNVHLAHASNLLKAIQELKAEDSGFDMYVMLGAWIDCKNAWTDMEPDHDQESGRNAKEIAKAVELAKAYPEIVKILAVGNEAMVKWATSYYVQPGVILKWVNHLQALKQNGELPQDLWITSSDDFSSWGGGGTEYHVDDLNELIKAVDYISMHTYPMHNTHYNPQFWGNSDEEIEEMSKEEKIDVAMNRSLDFAINQYNNVKAYMKSVGVDKPIHIGETGWASFGDDLYGQEGSKAVDEYKEGLYYQKMRKWSNENNISCFYFEAFDESWKDAEHPGGSENHFGLFTADGQAKYAVWDLFDEGVFGGLTRAGSSIIKTNNGSIDKVIVASNHPPTNNHLEIK